MKELKNLHSLNNKKLLVCLPVNKVYEKNINQILFSIREQTYPVDLLILTNNLSSEDENKLNLALEESFVEIPKQDSLGNFNMEKQVSTKKLNFAIEKTEKVNFSEVFNEFFNYAEKNSYDWFSVVETLDVLNKSWYKYFDDYSTAKSGYDVFTPITKQVNNNLFSGFLNEACWAEGMAEEAGVFDLNMLLRMNCINVTGTVFKVSSLKQYSEERDDLLYPMKENLKFINSYEFFLRFIYNDLKVYSIPRIGYEYSVVSNALEYDKFLSKVPTNLLNIAKENGGITTDEYQFWMQSAKKEYFFDEQRNIEYKDSI
jgi:hypothetical protein